MYFNFDNPRSHVGLFQKIVASIPDSRLLLYRPSVCPASCIDPIWGYITVGGMKRLEVIKSLGLKAICLLVFIIHECYQYLLHIRLVWIRLF